MGQIDIPRALKELADRYPQYEFIAKLKHLEPQKKAEDLATKINEWLDKQFWETQQEDTENIIYDYGFQAGRCYAKHHPEPVKMEEFYDKLKGKKIEKLKPLVKYNTDLQLYILEIINKQNQIIDYLNERD